MTTMLERAARALCEADTTAPDPDAAVLVGMKTMRAWEARLPLVCAVLEAIREPTPEMIAAFTRLNHPRDEEIWQAGIDTILEEG